MAARKFYRNPLKPCACCLYRVGFSTNQIRDRIRVAKVIIFRWVRNVGLKQLCRPSRSNQSAWGKLRGRLNETVEMDRRWEAQNYRRWHKLGTTERMRAWYQQYYQRNKKVIYARMKADPQRLAATRLRHRVYTKLKGANATKSARTFELVGCSPLQFKLHLEAQFLPGMTWSNYGQWEMDHVKPCASFDLTQPEQQRACFHYSNTRPLWKSANRRKWSYHNGRYHKRSRQNLPTPTPFTKAILAA